MTDDSKQNPDDVADAESNPLGGALDAGLIDGQGAFAAALDGSDGAPAQLGSTKYVHAAFFAAAILLGFIVSRFFVLFWNSLAEWPLALEHLPALVRFDEEVRSDIGMAVGAVVGAFALARIYQRKSVRAWAESVAGELAKVSWPDRAAVSNGTVIVIVASLIATVYVTILDKFWGFLTGRIYGP